MTDYALPLPLPFIRPFESQHKVNTENPQSQSPQNATPGVHQSEHISPSLPLTRCTTSLLTVCVLPTLSYSLQKRSPPATVTDSSMDATATALRDSLAQLALSVSVFLIPRLAHQHRRSRKDGFKPRPRIGPLFALLRCCWPNKRRSVCKRRGLRCTICLHVLIQTRNFNINK